MGQPPFLHIIKMKEKVATNHDTIYHIILYFIIYNIFFPFYFNFIFSIGATVGDCEYDDDVPLDRIFVSDFFLKLNLFDKYIYIFLQSHTPLTAATFLPCGNFSFFVQATFSSLFLPFRWFFSRLKKSCLFSISFLYQSYEGTRLFCLGFFTHDIR